MRLQGISFMMTFKSDWLDRTAFVGIGGCGRNMLETWQLRLPEGAPCLAVDRDKRAFITSGKSECRVILSGIKSKSSTVEYSDSVQKEVQNSLKEHLPIMDDQLVDRDSVILLAGLGGVVGSWASQLLCNHFISVGKQVDTVLVMPFSFEQDRLKVAKLSLSGFDGRAHRVLCFNDYLIKHTPDGISMQDAFEIMNEKAFEMLNLDA